MICSALTISQVDAASSAVAIASATVIAPVNVMTSWADLPVKVIWSGGWIRLAMPSAQPPVSSPSNPLNEADLAVGLPPSGSSALARDGAGADWRGTQKGTLHGEFTTALSAQAPLNGGSYRVTVAFN